MHGVDRIRADQCQLGQCDEEGQPVKKPTKWLSNSREILKKLELRCQGIGGWCSRPSTPERHRPSFGQVAKNAAIYPFNLCRAILEGLRNELVEKGRALSSLNVMAPNGLIDSNRKDFPRWGLPFVCPIPI